MTQKTLRQQLAVDLEVALLMLVPLALRKDLLKTVSEFVSDLPLVDETNRGAFLVALHSTLRDFQNGKIPPSTKAIVGDLSAEMSAVYLAAEHRMLKE